jgi:putative transport protein
MIERFIMAGMAAVPSGDCMGGSTSMPEAVRLWLAGQPLLALFLVLAVGMLLGSLRIKGIGLGSSGVLFAGLLAGHLGLGLPGGIGILGIVLFTYCVGLTAGPTFFSSLRRQGGDMANLAALTVGVGALATVALAALLHLDPALAAGLFAGALTSTPGLAVALDALGEQGRIATVGYGVAYPFGVAGVVLFIQLLPRLLGHRLRSLGGEGDVPSLLRRVVEITNPEFVGLPLARLPAAAGVGDFCVSRVMRHDALVPVTSADLVCTGMVVLVVTPGDRVAAVCEKLGRETSLRLHLDADQERTQIVITRPELLGRPLAELDLLSRFGVVVTRIGRDGYTVLAGAGAQLEYGDTLTVVGAPDALTAFARVAGHREKALHESDLATLALGLALGIGLGLVPLGIPGRWSFSLGLAGGPLFVALLLGHFRRRGWIAGHLPRAARQNLMELGLVFCLADAGVKAGATFLSVLHEHGAVLFLAGIVVTLLPMAVAYAVARLWFRLDLLATLGGICGGMTSTPALGVLVAEVDSGRPVTSYAAAYPVALILMTVFVQIILSLLG